MHLNLDQARPKFPTSIKRFNQVQK